MKSNRLLEIPAALLGVTTMFLLSEGVATTEVWLMACTGYALWTIWAYQLKAWFCAFMLSCNLLASWNGLLNVIGG